MWRSTRLKLRSTTFPIIYKWPCPCLAQSFCHIVCWWLKLFCTGKDLPSLIDTVNSELTIIVSWLNANKMSLTLKKISYMIFRSRNKKLDPGNDIFINGCKIEQVQTTKFLGVIIDCNLTWKYHISYVCSKISKNIGILIKSRKLFDTNTLLTLYYSFIYPYLLLCQPVGFHLWHLC